MKKKVLAFLCMLAVTVTSINLPAIPADTVKAAKTTGRTYYISSIHGNNANRGTTEAQAWETLDKLIDLELKPGDKVLLEKGSVFNDAYIHLIDVHGEEGNPIIISSYGNGAKPAIHANGQGVWYQQYGRNLDSPYHRREGYVSSTILLYDVDFVEISDLELTNESDDFDYFKGPAGAPELNIPENSGESAGSGNKRMDRTGVAGAAKNDGTMQHVYLDNLYIHDIDGNIGDKHMDNGGIQMNVLEPENEEKTGIARYDDIRITNCYVRDVSRAGICVGYTYQHARFSGQAISDETAQVYGHTNLLMENNYVKDVGNDGIVAMYAYRPLVQYNIADRAGADMDAKNGGYNTYYGYVCAGIWPWKSKDGIFQYNEAFDIVENQDGMPWDIDYSDGTVYQYNYSHNNGGGCVMFCGGEAYNGVFRYNISQNDLKGLLNLSGNPKGEVYNNVFYIGGDLSTKIHNPGFHNGTGVMRNNIFYNVSTAEPDETGEVKGEVDEPMKKTQDTWQNNIFYGYDNRFALDDLHGDGNISADPKFVDPGTSPTDVKAESEGAKASLHDRTIVYNGYKLQDGSPAINAGTFVEGAPKYDFFGNRIGLEPDIGVFESAAAESVLDIQIVGGSSLTIGEGKISGIGSRMTVKELDENLIYAQDVVFKVLKDNQEMKPEDSVTGDMKVRISRGSETKEYQIETAFGIQAARGSSIEIGEDEITISGTAEAMTVKDLSENLIYAQDVELKVLKGNQEAALGEIIATGMTLRISKGSESKEYQIKVVLGIQAVRGSSIAIGDNIISGVAKTMKVKELIGSLVYAQDVELKVINNNQEANPEDIVTDDMKVRLSRGSETAEYQIEVEKRYAEYAPGAMTARAGSEATSGGEVAANVLDDDLGTIWHSNWDGDQQSNIWIELDLGEEKPVAMVKYVSRNSGGLNGVFEDYEVMVRSSENEDWKTVKTGTWKNSSVGSTEYAKFNTVNARYVRLLCTKNRTAAGGSEGKSFGSASEIRVGYEVED